MGTDCSEKSVHHLIGKLSRPYGDGLFCLFSAGCHEGGVPSLRGRIVLKKVIKRVIKQCPVPTGTDCSFAGLFVCFAFWSRPYGDGLFRIRHFWKFLFSIPSLRGRIVLILLSWISEWACPVPTGTDYS